MSGAPIVVVFYKNGIMSYCTWISSKSILKRAKEIVEEGGKKLLEDVIWYEREPWTKKITACWAAVDSFEVALAFDENCNHPYAQKKKTAKKVSKKKAKKKSKG